MNERTQFRRLDEVEIRTIETVCYRERDYSIVDRLAIGMSQLSLLSYFREEALIQYSHLGSGFTVCSLLIGNQIKLGASRCSYRDRPNHIKGQAIALKRAILSKAPAIQMPNQNKDNQEKGKNHPTESLNLLVQMKSAGLTPIPDTDRPGFPFEHV